MFMFTILIRTWLKGDLLAGTVVKLCLLRDADSCTVTDCFLCLMKFICLTTIKILSFLTINGCRDTLGDCLGWCKKRDQEFQRKSLT